MYELVIKHNLCAHSFKRVPVALRWTPLLLPSQSSSGKSLVRNANKHCHQTILAYLQTYNRERCATPQVLGEDPANAKALFRRAQAYTMTGDFEEAERDYRDMQAADPSTEADAKAGLAKIKRREQVSPGRKGISRRHCRMTWWHKAPFLAVR